MTYLRKIWPYVILVWVMVLVYGYEYFYTDPERYEYVRDLCTSITGLLVSGYFLFTLKNHFFAFCTIIALLNVGGSVLVDYEMKGTQFIYVIGLTLYVSVAIIMKTRKYKTITKS